MFVIVKEKTEEIEGRRKNVGKGRKKGKEKKEGMVERKNGGKKEINN